MEGDSEELRKAASSWSLAGDQQLLSILQNIHQSLMTRCQEVNSRLDEMVNSLDDASIDLQNVNNKFMALSNAQFVESRVYDDDVEVVPPVPTKESSDAVDPDAEFSKLKASVMALQEMHEMIEIIDSDSDSESDEEGPRTVLKPKDMYNDRPLPYIIGSLQWRRKWHAGLLPEDSDTDSASSKIRADDERYSDSEQEWMKKLDDEWVGDDHNEDALRNTDSAENSVIEVPETEVEITKPKPIFNYRPPAPPAGVIFPDEPPPFDQNQSEEESLPEEDDIFAELHRNSSNRTEKKQNSLAEDLFDSISGVKKESVNDKKPEHKVDNSKSSLFDDEQEPDLFADSTVSKNDFNQQNVKKPVGGISIFGSKGAASIGEAILKRSKRSSSDEDEEIQNDNIKKQEEKRVNEEREAVVNVESDINPSKSIQKDIFNDIFAKNLQRKDIKETKIGDVTKDDEKVDLFSDNLFDDIDDIFSGNITVSKNDTKSNINRKSIFDDDVDDLFAELPVTKGDEPSARNRNSIDDDLFSDTKTDTKFNTKAGIENIFDDTSDVNTVSGIKEEGTKKPENVNTNKKEEAKSDEFSNKQTVSHKDIIPTIKGDTKTSFLDDDDEFDDLFSINKVTADVNESKQKSSLFPNAVSTDFIKGVDNKNDEVLIEDSSKSHASNTKDGNNIPGTSVDSKKPSIFDDDTVNDDLFDGYNKNNERSKTNNNVIKESLNIINNTIDNNNDTSLVKDRQSQVDKKEDEMREDSKIFVANPQTKPDIPEPDFDIHNEVENREREEKSLFNETEDSLFSAANDIFNDMVDEPPVFEKSKEPKKSKNVNALFDDDSDDEALFFKKSEVIDDKPDYDDSKPPLFDIFHTEPPAIDVNFIEKDDDEILSTSFGDDLFTSSDKGDENKVSVEQIANKTSILIENIHNTLQTNILEDKATNVISPEGPKREYSENIDNVPNIPHHNEPKNTTNIVDDTNTLKYTKDSELKHTKKVGKLKNSNFNIDVSTLLPGASPKKKSIEQTDGQTYSTKSQENLHSQDKPVDQIMTKSISFDGEIESQVLNNTFSKERAKIQVKRRPSTRRARLEAARKSAAEFSEDTTDNSKIDDVSKSDVVANIIEPLEISNMTNKVDIDHIKAKEFEKNASTTHMNEDKVLEKKVISTKLEKELTNDSKNIERNNESSLFNETNDLDTNLAKDTKETLDFDKNNDIPSSVTNKHEIMEISKNNDQFDILKASNSNNIIFKDEINRTSKNIVNKDKNYNENDKIINIHKEISHTITNKGNISDTDENSSKNMNKNFDILDQNDSSSDIKKDEIAKINKEEIDKTNTDINKDEIRKINTDINKDEFRTNNRDEIRKINKDEIDQTNTEIFNNTTFARNYNAKVISKVVYILNDEDIFTNNDKPSDPAKVNRNDDFDDIFKSESVKPTNLNTIGNIYKNDDSKNVVIDGKKAQSSLFGDENDDELFGEVKRTVKSKSILDSDSEDELFRGKKEKKEKQKSLTESKAVKMKVDVKSSLFSDDDDDDLFGAKTKANIASTSQTARSFREPQKPTEPVYDDPLSLFGNDEE